MLFYRLFNRIQILQEIFQQIGSGSSAYWSINQLIDIAHSAKEIESFDTNERMSFNIIDFDFVGYSYEKSAVFNNVSFQVKSNGLVAISGPSGSGKTTLIDLFCGLLRPTEGRILIDGTNLNEISKLKWRSLFGYVPQEMFLLNDTIFNNVAMGDPSISRNDVKEVLNFVGISDTVNNLENGIDTNVGERGARFSGGQRQRLSLARALVRKPKILIIDEIAAALDVESARKIYKQLRTLANEMLIIVVSHQFEIVDYADAFLSFENGKFNFYNKTK